MPIRKVKVPHPILIKNTDGTPAIVDDGRELVIPFSRVLTHLLNHPQFLAPYENIRAANAIDSAFEGQGPGSVVELGDKEWSLLKKAVENPQQVNANGSLTQGLGWMPHVQRQLTPMLEAIVEAQEKQPNGSKKDERRK